MDKIIIIAGPTAAGKDSAMIELLKIRPEIKPLISYTTRPIRPGETDGVEYIFIGEEEFNVLSRDNLILSGRTYTTIQNGETAVWHYGAPYPEQKGDYVTIVDHKGAKNIINKIGRKGVALIYLDAPDEVLKRRSLERLDEAAEFDRRLIDDREEFKDIEDIYDLGIRTDMYRPLQIAEYIGLFLEGRNL